VPALREVHEGHMARVGLQKARRGDGLMTEIDELREFILARARAHWNARHGQAMEELVKLAGSGVVDTNMLRWLAYPDFAHRDYKTEWLPR
jgi:hypothetical protein